MSFETIVNALGWTLLHSLWQGAIIGLLFVLSRSVLQTASPTLRHTNALAWLVLFVCLPIFTFAGLVTTTPGATVMSSVPTMIASVPISSWSEGSVSVLPFSLRLLGCLWLSGVFVLLVQLWRDWRQLDRFTCAGVEPLPQLEACLATLREAMQVRTRVTLAEAGNATVPMVVGLLKPMIIVPSSVLLGLTPRELELIVAHELAHLKRKDHLVNYLLIAAETLLFYHPVVYALTRTIRHERELCCDDMVIGTFNERVCYAHALSKLETLRGIDVVPVSTLRLAAADGPLVMRIARLVQHRTHKRWGVMPAALLPFVATGLTLFVFHQTQVASVSGTVPSKLTQQTKSEPAILDQTGFPGLKPVLLASYQRREVAATTVSKITTALTQGQTPQPLAALERGIQKIVDTGRVLASESNNALPGKIDRVAYDAANVTSGSLKAQSTNANASGALPESLGREPSGSKGLTGSSTGFARLTESGDTAGTNATTSRFPADSSTTYADSSRIAYDMSELTNVFAPVAREAGLPALPSHLLPSNAGGVAKKAGVQENGEVPDTLSGGSLIHSVVPKYPNRARSRGLVDKVVVSIEIDATGSVNQVSVVNDSGRAMFRRAVVRAVSQWKFEPLLRNGQPVEQTLEQSFDFRLQPYTARKRLAACRDTDGNVCSLSS